jgi:hypothetical protein
MSEAATDSDRAMLAELAEMDLALARKLHAVAMAADEPDVTAELSRAYQRQAHSLRQTLALKTKLALDQAKHDRARQSADLHEAVHYYGLRPHQLPPTPVPDPPSPSEYLRPAAERFRPEGPEWIGTAPDDADFADDEDDDPYWRKSEFDACPDPDETPADLPLPLAGRVRGWGCEPSGSEPTPPTLSPSSPMGGGSQSEGGGAASGPVGREGSETTPDPLAPLSPDVAEPRFQRPAQTWRILASDGPWRGSG